jgi:protein-S-isoprenylcysteine O-methyltransferase Ste14
MKRTVCFAYGLASYAAFLAAYVYLYLFLGNLFVPRSVDGPATTPPLAAATINVLLLAAFGLQHSIMARPAFKRLWTRVVPHPIERSTYVLASSAVLVLLFWQWRPIAGTLWNVQNPTGRSALWALFAAGWLMVPAVSLMISHADLFGLRQTWLYFRGREYSSLPFRTPLLYAHIRHPLYVGWAIFFWAAPVMTYGHALFAAVLTAYMAIAALIEERDLVAHFGALYENYMRNVPRYIPRLGVVALNETAAPTPSAAPAPFTPRSAEESALP